MATSKIFRTYDYSHEFSFSWEIENFHQTSLKVRGADFKPIPGFAYEFFFELELKESEFGRKKHCLFVKLINKMTHPSDDNLKMKCKMALSNSQKLLCTSNPRTIFTLQQATVLMTLSEEGCWSKLGLTEGKFILEGTLTFSVCKETSIMCPVISIKRPSEENAKKMKTIYEGGLASGVVTFHINNKKIAAHKAVLCAGSPVFEKMFGHDMVENKTNKVDIEDFDFETFNCFLAYLYTGVVKVASYNSALSLYYVGKKYQVKSLQDSCFSLLTNRLTVELVRVTLLAADVHNDNELKEAVNSFVRDNFLEIVGTEKWAHLVTDYPNLTRQVLDYIKCNPK